MATEKLDDDKLYDDGLYDTKSFYPLYISLEAARYIKVNEFYGILRKIALNKKIRKITNDGSFRLIQIICSYFRKLQQSTNDSTVLNLPDAVEEVYMPSFANSGTVVRSFFLAIGALIGRWTSGFW